MAIPLLALAGGSAAAGGLGALLGNRFAQQALAASQKNNAMMGLAQLFGSQNRPEITDTPEYKNLMSEWERTSNLEEDKAARKQALDSLRGVIEGGGADPAFRQALETNLMRSGKQTAARDNALLDNATRRGVTGGLEFAMRRGNQADAANTEAQIATDLLGQQMNRYDNATNNLYQGQNDWLSRRAEGMDSMGRFNKANSWGAQMDKWRAQNNLSQQQHNEGMNAVTQYGQNKSNNTQQFWQNQNNLAGGILGGIGSSLLVQLCLRELSVGASYGICVP